LTSATPSNLTIPDRPLDVQKAILEAEREAWYNTVFQSRARLEAQELIQRTFKREGADGQIKALTESIEDAVVAIGHYDKKLAALEKQVEKAKTSPESAKAA
jgi:hypothetical protein